jgi:hypothetical protein
MVAMTEQDERPSSALAAAAASGAGEGAGTGDLVASPAR